MNNIKNGKKISSFLLSASTYRRVDKKLLINFFSLGLIQLTNFVIPLITYPYLFRILGDNYFGAFIYAFNVMFYLSNTADYGFNMSAPRTIVLNRENPSNLSKSVSTILQTKFYLLLICCIIVGIGFFFSERVQADIWLYSLGLVYVAGTCVLPTWLFQGLEDMKQLTWINFIAKICTTGMVFILIQKPEDYIYVIVLFGVANLLSGLLGIIYAKHKYKLALRWVPFKCICTELRNGWYYFLSNFSSVTFSNSTIFILGFFVTNEIIGFYGIAEKIAFAAWQLINVFSQATYPVLCRLSIESHSSVVSFMKKYHLLFVILIALACMVVFTKAEWILELATGAIQSNTVTLLRLLSIVPFIVCLNVSAYQMFLIYEKQKYNFLIFNVVLIFSTLLCMALSYTYGAQGAAWATLITQIALTLSLHLVLANRFPQYALFSASR